MFSSLRRGHCERWEEVADLRKRLRQASIPRRVAIAALCFLLLVYILISFFSSSSTLSSAHTCIEDRLRQWKMLGENAQISTSNAHIIFVGNGFFGVGGDGELRIRSESSRVLSILTSFFPLITTSLSDYSSQSFASVVDFRVGLFKKIQCYALKDECSCITTTVYAHRTRPHVLVQDVQTTNPTFRVRLSEWNFPKRTPNTGPLERKLARLIRGGDSSKRMVWTSSWRQSARWYPGVLASKTNVKRVCALPVSLITIVGETHSWWRFIEADGVDILMAAICSLVPRSVSIENKREESMRFTCLFNYDVIAKEDDRNAKQQQLTQSIVKVAFFHSAFFLRRHFHSWQCILFVSALYAKTLLGIMNPNMKAYCIFTPTFYRFLKSRRIENKREESMRFTCLFNYDVIAKEDDRNAKQQQLTQSIVKVAFFHSAFFLWRHFHSWQCIVFVSALYAKTLLGIMNPNMKAYCIFTPTFYRFLKSRREHLKSVSFKEFADTLSIGAASLDEEHTSAWRREFADTLSIGAASLDEEHTSAWRLLNRVSFGISKSLAPDALNGDLINATRYALLSNTRAPLLEHASTEQQKKEASTLLERRNMCYTGHSTMLVPSRLWKVSKSVRELIDTVDVWLLTLEKRGCASLLKAGAVGVADAFALSLFASKFSGEHLEVDMDPRDLHREMTIENLNFSSDTKLSIAVRLDSDNRPYFSMFVCDAACLNAPLGLESTKVHVPVKVTRPATPILYLSKSRQHLEQLRGTIHVIEVLEAPAHEQELIALHKHGHRLGGLPLAFWIMLGMLVLAFHLFLFKLLYSEWKKADSTPYNYYLRQRYMRIH
uniref:Membrane-associated protein n=1 Tax=Ascaris lumbricoides TaxID=6252 RepID=A0A9J2PXP6_ASCLU